ncbi:hypothetical protein GCK32_005557 [Trichostrongylus colubriformis]|uniref:Uncharacterized protein n=1 Tax=Trichostrongylus colubriformis TaxID=6319 RepID=A0AAN8FJY1_TRICO
MQKIVRVQLHLEWFICYVPAIWSAWDNLTSKKVLMAYVSFTIAYMTNLYLIVMLIYISNLVVITVLAKKLAQIKSSTPRTTTAPNTISPQTTTAKEPTDTLSTATGTDRKLVEPRIKRSVFLIDATQEQDQSPIQAVQAKKRKRKRKKSRMETKSLLETQDEEKEETHTAAETPRTRATPRRSQTPKTPYVYRSVSSQDGGYRRIHYKKKKPSIAQTQPEPEEGHLPRAPKGHHEEELQQMEEILNEMSTRPRTAY